MYSFQNITIYFDPNFIGWLFRLNSTCMFSSVLCGLGEIHSHVWDKLGKLDLSLHVESLSSEEYPRLVHRAGKPSERERLESSRTLQA